MYFYFFSNSYFLAFVTFHFILFSNVLSCPCSFRCSFSRLGYDCNLDSLKRTLRREWHYGNAPRDCVVKYVWNQSNGATGRPRWVASRPGNYKACPNKATLASDRIKSLAGMQEVWQGDTASHFSFREPRLQLKPRCSLSRELALRREWRCGNVYTHAAIMTSVCLVWNREEQH